MLLAAAVLHTVEAQIYQFEQVRVPEASSLHTLYAFYIYSHQEAPERSLGRPFIKFHSLAAHSLLPERPDSSMRAYEGIELSILPFKDFWTFINPNKVCSTDEDVRSKAAQRPGRLMLSGSMNNAFLHTVQFPANSHFHAKEGQMPVLESGVYILVFSNCGNFSEAEVSGSVIVKNAYGFLPGNEYHKMPFYGWLSLIYVAMALAWMGLSLRWWRELFHIQYCIAAVIFFGLVEAFLWWMCYNDWNRTGIRGRFLFIMAILSSVVKSIFSYMLALVASLGWGVTRPYLDRRTILKVQGITFLYTVMDFVRTSVLSFRHSHSLSLPFVLFCLLPVALLNGAIFYWIFTALSSLMETLRERRQHEKLQLFERLWAILVFALSLASLTLLFQIFDLSRSINIRWHYQWFFADGVSHILFLFVLAAMMYLWAPNKNSQRYAYSHLSELGDDEEDGETPRAKTVWDDDDDDAEDDSFFTATRGQAGQAGGAKASPAADTIGAQETTNEPVTAAAEKA